MGIEAFSMLPASQPLAKRARELLTILFGSEGLSFLKLSYAEQWSIADTMLKRIDEDGLQKDIDDVAGPDFLAHVRTQHAAYGAMAQSIMRRDDATAVNLHEHVRVMGRAIVDYSTKVLGMLDEDAPESVAVVRDALRPLDAYREAAARRNVTPTTPPNPLQPVGEDSSG